MVRTKVVSKDVDAGGNGVRARVAVKYSHACPKIKLQKKHL